MSGEGDEAETAPSTSGRVGRSVPRIEDAALPTGHGRFIDDLGVRPGTPEAAILRSPHAHAEIEAINCRAALAADGVFAVLAGADIRAGDPRISVRSSVSLHRLRLDRNGGGGGGA